MVPQRNAHQSDIYILVVSKLAASVSFFLKMIYLDAECLVFKNFPEAPQHCLPHLTRSLEETNT